MAVDQSGQHRHFREINHSRASGNCEPKSNRLNLVGADHDHLVARNRTLVRINQLAGHNHRDLA